PPTVCTPRRNPYRPHPSCLATHARYRTTRTRCLCSAWLHIPHTNVFASRQWPFSRFVLRTADTHFGHVAWSCRELASRFNGKRRIKRAEVRFSALLDCLSLFTISMSHHLQQFYRS